MAATLNCLVPSVIGDIILLVRLEEVACTHLVASLEYPLLWKSRQVRICIHRSEMWMALKQGWLGLGSHANFLLISYEVVHLF